MIKRILYEGILRISKALSNFAGPNKSLAHNGVISHLRLNETDTLVAWCSSRRKFSLQADGSDSGKCYWNDLIKSDEWYKYKEIISFLRANPMLKIIADDYLRNDSFISHVNLQESFHAYGDPGARNFHRDGDDTKIFKVFIYCDNVSKPSGPLEYIPLKNDFWPLRIFPMNLKRFSHNNLVFKILRAFNKFSHISVNGPAGHSFVVDTARLLHRGSLCEPGHSRLALWITFISRKPLAKQEPKSFLKRCDSTDHVFAVN